MNQQQQQQPEWTGVTTSQVVTSQITRSAECYYTWYTVRIIFFLASVAESVRTCSLKFLVDTIYIIQHVNSDLHFTAVYDSLFMFIVILKSFHRNTHLNKMLSASGNLFECHEEVLYLQPLIPPKRFDIFSPITCSEGLGVL